MIAFVLADVASIPLCITMNPKTLSNKIANAQFNGFISVVATYLVEHDLVMF